MSAVVLTLIVAACLLAAFIAPYDPTAGDVSRMLEGPSAEYWLGTDQLGRDILSRILYGGRIDLAIAFGVLVAPLVIGVGLGLLAGLSGGWVDSFVMRTCDAVQAFPLYVLVLAIVFTLGPGVLSIFIAFTLVNWVPYARLTRGDVLVCRRSDYVLAARAAGYSPFRVALKHVLPNVLRQPMIYQMSDVVQNMLAIVTLGYLGLGVQPPTPDWGAMISSGQPFITSHPLLSILPGLCVVIIGLLVATIGEGLSSSGRSR